MQVNLNLSTASITRAETGKAPSAPPKAGGETEFMATAALGDALAQIPDVRTAEVARARQLVDTRIYPPPELIRRIARLVAQNLHNAAE
jgi:hypothetical protein